MPFTITWDNPEHTTLLVVYEEHWSWDDVDQASELLLTYLTEVDHRFDIIVQMPSGNWIPPGSIVSHYHLVAKIMSHPTSRLLVIVVSSKLLEIFAGIMRQTYHHLARRIIITSTLGRAHTKLEQFSRQP
jgi:hypothetical protein